MVLNPARGVGGGGERVVWLVRSVAGRTLGRRVFAAPLAWRQSAQARGRDFGRRDFRLWLPTLVSSGEGCEGPGPASPPPTPTPVPASHSRFPPGSPPGEEESLRSPSIRQAQSAHQRAARLSDAPSSMEPPSTKKQRVEPSSGGSSSGGATEPVSDVPVCAALRHRLQQAQPVHMRCGGLTRRAVRACPCPQDAVDGEEPPVVDEKWLALEKECVDRFDPLTP